MTSIPSSCEPELDWSAIDPCKPLVFCALGREIRAVCPTETARFIRTVMAAAASRPDWQFIVVDDDGRARRPPNVAVVREAPQLAALRRAAVMISHGGNKSIKECLLIGVPLVVCPAKWDQFANANRVRFHGLGVVGDFYKISPRELSALLDEVFASGTYRAAARAMSERFRVAERGDAAVLTVERFLRRAESASR